MKILLTGATGYIGKRLLPNLLDLGHIVVCSVRDKNRFTYPEKFKDQILVIELDLLNKASLENIPNDIDIAYYLVHSMSTNKQYQDLERQSAENFRKRITQTNCKQVIYLSGIINEKSLSKHLASRKGVENELANGSYYLTTLRAGIIIGSGSASFEIIRDLVEKLPIMITPKWLNTKCQSIGIRDVLAFLVKSIGNEKVYNKNFDIGGSDILTYKEMLLAYAKERGLSRHIFTVPVMTPKLSSYWLYFVTSTSYKLATALVSSMKVEVVCRNDDINQILNIFPASYEKSLERALRAIKANNIPSSWKDSLVSGVFDKNIHEYLKVPEYGCFIDKRKMKIVNRKNTIEKIWDIGGNTGWYFANILWDIRGFIDKLFGGVGLRRGRSSDTHIYPGDALDFWRVLYADKENGHLLLFAEMKLPGEAWLEFKIENDEIVQTATFRPKGLAGRLYWYSVLPFHGLIFNGMLRKLTE